MAKRFDPHTGEEYESWPIATGFLIALALDAAIISLIAWAL